MPTIWDTVSEQIVCILQLVSLLKEQHVRRWFLTLVMPLVLLGCSFSAYATPVFDSAGTILLGFDALTVDANLLNQSFDSPGVDLPQLAGAVH